MTVVTSERLEVGLPLPPLPPPPHSVMISALIASHAN